MRIALRTRCAVVAAASEPVVAAVAVVCRRRPWRRSSIQGTLCGVNCRCHTWLSLSFRSPPILFSPLKAAPPQCTMSHYNKIMIWIGRFAVALLCRRRRVGTKADALFFGLHTLDEYAKSVCVLYVRQAACHSGESMGKIWLPFAGILCHCVIFFFWASIARSTHINKETILHSLK